MDNVINEDFLELIKWIGEDQTYTRLNDDLVGYLTDRPRNEQLNVQFFDCLRQFKSERMAESPIIDAYANTVNSFYNKSNFHVLSSEFTSPLHGVEDFQLPNLSTQDDHNVLIPLHIGALNHWVLAMVSSKPLDERYNNLRKIMLCDSYSELFASEKNTEFYNTAVDKVIDWAEFIQNIGRDRYSVSLSGECFQQREFSNDCGFLVCSWIEETIRDNAVDNPYPSRKNFSYECLDGHIIEHEHDVQSNQSANPPNQRNRHSRAVTERSSERQCEHCLQLFAAKHARNGHQAHCGPKRKQMSKAKSKPNNKTKSTQEKGKGKQNRNQKGRANPNRRSKSKTRAKQSMSNLRKSFWICTNAMWASNTLWKGKAKSKPKRQGKVQTTIKARK